MQRKILHDFMLIKARRNFQTGFANLWFFQRASAEEQHRIWYPVQLALANLEVLLLLSTAVREKAFLQIVPRRAKMPSFVLRLNQCWRWSTGLWKNWNRWLFYSVNERFVICYFGPTKKIIILDSYSWGSQEHGQCLAYAGNDVQHGDVYFTISYWR